MKRLVGRTGTQGLELEAARGRMLVEESREIVIVLDSDGRVVAMSRRARQAIPGLEEGKHPPEDILGSGARVPSAVTYDVGGRQETILYLTAPGELAAYEELRAGFTAAVSHELGHRSRESWRCSSPPSSPGWTPASSSSRRAARSTRSAS